MNQDKKEYISGWFEKADHDIVMAERAIEIAPVILDSACFHCQQAIEKYLKAYLIYQGKKLIKTHDLALLCRLCAEYDYAFENINLKALDDFSVEIRYPDDSLIPTLDEAKEYLQIAESVRDIVRKKIIFDA